MSNRGKPVVQDQRNLSQDRKRKREGDEEFSGPPEANYQKKTKIDEQKSIFHAFGSAVSGVVKRFFTPKAILESLDLSDDDEAPKSAPMKSRQEPAAQSALMRPRSSSAGDVMQIDSPMPPPPSRRPEMKSQQQQKQQAPPPQPSQRSLSFRDVYAMPSNSDRDRLRSASSERRLKALSYQSLIGLPFDEDEFDFLSADDGNLEQYTRNHLYVSDSEELGTLDSEDRTPHKTPARPTQRRLYNNAQPLQFSPSGFESPPSIAAQSQRRQRRHSSPGDLPSAPIDVESYMSVSRGGFRDATRLMLEREQSIFPSYHPAIFDDDLQREVHIRTIELLQPLRQRAVEYKKDLAKEIAEVQEQAKKDAEENLRRVKREQEEATLKAELEERQRREALLPAGAPPLNQKELEVVQSAWNRRDAEIISEKFNIDVKGEHIKTLKPGGWLNDEIINFYMELLNERCQKDPSLPRCHFFNSFFYKLLSTNGYDFSRVRTWTKKVDLFALDKVIAPIHLGNHWCLAVMNMKRKRFEYYDSMGGTNPECIAILRRYLSEEHQIKKKAPLDLSDWTVFTPGREVPQQHNGSDCGVFACRFADCVASERSFRFSQSDMPLFRKSMVVEVLEARLRTHPK